MMQDILTSAFLGTVEGLTEFIPVSSTAHILLVEWFFGIDSPGPGFEVLIQLGAVLAVVTVYVGRLLEIARNLGHDPAARRFLLVVLLAFLPAAIAGVFLQDIIFGIFYLSPSLMAWMLILGGIALLAVERWRPEPRHADAQKFKPMTGLGIGLFQCLALVPGVSRSGATIVGAMLLGAERRAAADFSFFLAMPTMLGAFAWTLIRNRDLIDSADAANIAIGFAAAFISGLIVVRWLLGFVSRHGFALFAWWRIAVGLIVLVRVWIG